MVLLASSVIANNVHAAAYNGGCLLILLALSVTLHIVASVPGHRARCLPYLFLHTLYVLLQMLALKVLLALSVTVNNVCAAADPGFDGASPARHAPDHSFNSR